MSTKTKLVSLLIALLLVLPAIINPVRQGSVLGVQEDKSKTGQISAATENQGAIAGGVMENKLESSSLPEDTVKGLAVLNREAKTSVTAKNFTLASEINVSFKDKKLDLIVSGKDETLAENVVLVLDEATFKSLGANPQTETQIEVLVENAK